MSDSKKLYELLSRFDTAMLVTHSSGEQLRARPMQIAKLEEDGRVWFITSRESGKIHEIEIDRQVLLVFQEERSVYLSMEGLATLVDDSAQVAAIWKEPFKVWFPKGKDDPDIVLINVTPIRTEFWDNSGVKKISYLWEAAKAYATGSTPEIKEGEQHGMLS